MCHRYWPEAGTEVYGSFEVSVHAVREYPDYTLREFKIVDIRVSQTTENSVLRMNLI